jgi:putative holliday junction resolvase
LSSSFNQPKQITSVFLAFDFGLSYTGVAVGNHILKTARPLGVINATSSKQRFEKITEIIAQWVPDALVLGVPCHPDGQAHEMTAHCKKFARQLQGRYGLPVFQVDERYSSVQAQANYALSRDSNPCKTISNRSQRLDDHAACIILEQFFLENFP